MLRSGYVALAACALSVVLSACGSSDDDLVAGDMTISLNEDTSTRVTLIGNDASRTDLTGVVVQAPTKGDVVFSGIKFTYTPRPNENGGDTFTYQVSDGKKTSNVGRVAITINPVDDPPAIQPTLATDQDVSVTAVLIADVEGDTFTSAIVTPPANGTLTVDASNPGKFTYVPNAGFNGTDTAQLSASYTAPDATTATVTGTVTITVRPAATPPGGVGEPVHTLQGVSARFETLANNSNAEGGALAVTILSAPAVGTATVNADGSIQYTPPDAFVGNTSLEYQVRDARGVTSKATMEIGVGLTSGVLYLSRPDYSSPNELFFNDGARSFKVSGVLSSGDSVDQFTPARSAPVVFYRTLHYDLYRVDLRQPANAQLIGKVAGSYSIDDTGSKVYYSAPANSVDAVPGAPLRAADGSFEVVLAAPDIYALNLRDAAQLIPISTQIAESPALIPNF